jgi:hypothetical protein
MKLEKILTQQGIRSKINRNETTLSRTYRKIKKKECHFCQNMTRFQYLWQELCK